MSILALPTRVFTMIEPKDQEISEFGAFQKPHLSDFEALKW